ncbi:serine/arginine repetitive matrix protein 2 isoform X1 [Cheilinus undulatus]|uniref:serine/arginine repetitive matrix protein 2 isoform X1 n=1 Tax=Cheilinus undulatus TaxID=241271 RepID=UPI001BD22F9C|nr:serine/arginine repetitive matrix protein 2 isoform X1 [Cheilinus undulatus]
MATVQCSKCSAERKGFRRELDSWRHKLIHCVGFESILEGIYGPLLLRDLNLFDDCEPEEVDDWSSDANFSQCSFCNLPLDKNDQVPVATSPLSSPSEYSPCQAPTISESNQSAYRFLQAVFHKKDVPISCDSSIPLIAQELMKKMIHQFAKEYASKCLLHTTTNGVTTKTSSPLSETSDAPLDLTVSRTLEEKESKCEPDGVLDLSKGSSASSSNHKASGSLLPSFSEEMGDLGQRGTKCFRSSVLGAVLGSLCPSHSSLLYQILKLAHQENLLSDVNHRPVGQTQSICCHCGVNPQDNNLNAVPFSECKAHNSSLYNPSVNWEHQDPESTICHSGDSKSNCIISHFTLPGCKRQAPLCSSCGCLQRCKMETYTVLCPKRLHCTSCHSPTAGHISNKVCSFASPPLSNSPSPGSCALICCNQHKPHSCPCYTNHASLTQDRNTEKEGDPPCPVLKREQSPSPPPLSPILSDVDKNDEKPPSLLHHKQERADQMLKDGLVNSSHEGSVDTTTDEDQECQSSRGSPDEQNSSGNLLQDVVSRFSEKLETIKPIEKDRPLVSTAVEKEKQQSPVTSQNLQFHAHMTEIITTVLHTGRASDYNLSELFNRHDSKDPKSPNTRSRRRQEVLAAMATPTDNASARRQTLQIKRDLAMFDQSHSKKKVPVAKRPKLKDENVTTLQAEDLNVIKEESKRNTGKSEPLQGHRIENSPLNISTTESNEEKLKEEMQTVIVTEEVKIIKAEEKVGDVSALEKDLTFSGTQILNPELSGKYSKQGSNDDGEQTKAMPATTTSAKQRGRPCKKVCTKTRAARERKHKEALSEHNSDSNGRLGKQKNVHTPIRQQQVCQPHHSKEARRSRRNIVPPHRFSSYVTEPRKMFFVACFSENIFNLKTRKNEDLTASPVYALSKDPDSKDIQLESRKETPQPSPDHTSKRYVRSDKKSKCLSAISVSPQKANKEKSPTKDLKDGEGVAAKPFGRLRSSPKRTHDQTTVSATQETQSSSTITPAHTERPLNSQVEYTSPIKLMFVSPVTDEEGVRYSLKSAGSNSSGQEEAFDPCVESSWAGVPQKHKGIEFSPSKGKRISSPLKSATSPARSASSPSKSPRSPPKSATSPKSASSPQKSTASPPKSTCSSPKSDKSPKSVSSPPKTATPTFKSSPSPAKATSSPTKAGSSPKSVSSSPKIVLRRSGDGTPTKRAAGTESQRSPGNPLAYHETTPPKRRPGRPKKLGPQLEQKVKRPIGRPRKEKGGDSATGTKMENGTSASLPDSEKKENKNLKITVVYGRSRRNKRTVSEGFDQLQTELHDAWQAVGLKNDISIIMSNCKTSSGRIQTASTESSEELNFVNPLKQCAPQSSSKVKCHKQDDSITTRKPGRPAKVKISGISVTVTTVSPRQRKILINKDTRQSPKKLKKVLKPEIKFAKETWTINHQLTSKISHTEEKLDTKNESQDALPNQCVAVRQSMRVRKPSVHFLHAVATSTSRSYSHSNALLRRSKQFLLNKANNERRQGEQQSSAQTSGEKRTLFGHERNNISKDLSRVAALSVNSIFTPTETLRWWPASAEEKTMDQELARRIRLISDTWVSDTDENQEKGVAFCSKIATKSNSSLTRKSQCSSLVRTLFDCPPNKPRSCSMQQLCSWFMQTTETRSLAIVKKASSRNPYEVMHFPRSANKKMICHSPQAERLRKHIKKFAKVMPKSPLQHQQAQRRMRMRNKTPPSTQNTRRQLFSPRPVKGRFSQGAQWRSRKSFGKYQATLSRARTRFLSQETRKKWQKRKKSKKNLKRATPRQNGRVVSRIQPRSCPLRRAARTPSTDCLRKSSATSSVEQTQEPIDEQKEQNLCSKAWSPETLKECRVFLRKINSPDNELPEEEGDSCTVTLDDGSPSAYHFSRRQKELVEVVKAVKTESKRNTSRSASRHFSVSAPKSVQEKNEMPTGRQNGRYKSSGALSEEQPPPPAKKLRQSRMRGLTGPRWCDFVFET